MVFAGSGVCGGVVFGDSCGGGGVTIAVRDESNVNVGEPVGVEVVGVGSFK